MLLANRIKQIWEAYKLTQSEVAFRFKISTSAYGLIEYSEIKFFKNIRHRLKINDENIMAVFPNIEQF
jgi:transcriptional regulator with XRE-family HTH domain